MPRQTPPQSHLFTVRLWQEGLGNDVYEVRMQVKHILSGETRYFRAWQSLTDYLQQVMQESAK